MSGSGSGLDLDEICPGLERDPEGIWRSSGAVSAISYPEDSNRRCFDVEGRSYWFRHRNRAIVAAVDAHPPEGAVFDVGGGNGFVARALLDNGRSVVLLEPGPVGALNAKRERAIPDVVCSTLFDAGFVSGSVPAIGLFDVLEHIEDDVGFLAEVARVLEPGGRLYLTVPSFRGLWSLSDVRAGHFRRYTGPALSRLLADGFRVDYWTYFFALLVVPLFLFRSLPYRLGLARNANLLPAAAEHGTGSPRLRSLMSRLLRGELRSIRRGRRLVLGTSCLLVATRLGSSSPDRPSSATVASPGR